eukprot:gnl/TRDRNA2_/TRDRNA2_182048_c0_seq1.p1 gnl/TRDRNA2_/TRDRNA2_182048_c0~~gnl/TRDRNA2_/TRDRNA2_182048_c0_seq1.p1  ORF type:complete len:164 (+),score=21.37 gnl/TRDRNA2_/TRDRNA2_182048_c0_seq1:98-589(+)
MHTVQEEHLPEVYERKCFPFRPSRPPSPCSSRMSSSTLRRHKDKAAVENKAGRPYVLTTHGIEFSNEPGPALRSLSTPSMRRQLDAVGDTHRDLDRTHRKHNYSTNHEFGHHMVSNDVNPFLAHYRLPKWQTTNDLYGNHYKHPEQRYTRAMKNRMPVFQINI